MKSFVFAGIAFSLLLSGAVLAQATPSVLDSTALTEVISAEVQAQGAPAVAVAVVYGGETIFSQGFGMRNRETQDPATPDTLFRIGSTTKPLTAIGILRLVEQGKLDLDAPVVNYVPEFSVNPAIRVRHLLSHTGGLKDNAIPYGRRDPAALSDYIASWDERARFAEAGQVFSYSNPGFDLLGRVIETVSGQSYADYMAQEVFPALGMKRSTLDPNMAMTYPLATGYSRGLLGSTPVRPQVDNVAEYPAGFVFSSVNDLTRLAQFFIQQGVLENQPVLSAERVTAMQTPVTTSGTMGYGLGVFVDDSRGVRAVGHDGAITGYSSFFITLPEQGLGVVVLANIDGFDATPIYDAVLEQLLDLPAVSAEPAPALTAEQLAEYVGAYTVENIYGEEPITVTIALQEGVLKAAIVGQGTFVLRPSHPDRFKLYLGEMDMGAEVSFLRDATGAVQFISAGARAGARQADIPN